MEVIIEYVLIDNFCVDALLMWLSLKILKQPILKWGIVSVGIIGAGFACVSPLINDLIILPVKLGMAFFLAIISNFSLQKVWSRFLTFTAITFLFGGALMGFIGANVDTNNGLFYISPIPIGAVIAMCVIFVLLCYRFVKKLSKIVHNEVINLKICVRGKTKLVSSFVDTGNMLHSSKGLPVVVVDESLLANWFSMEERMALFLGQINSLNLNNIEKINVSSLGKEYQMTIFDAEVKFGGESKQVAIGISKMRFNLSGQAIIGREIWEVCNV